MQRDMTHERADGRKPEVAGPRGVAAFCLEMVEEGEDERRVDVLDPQGRGRSPGALSGVAEQQLEGVPVAGDRVRAGAALGDQAPLEEVLEQRREAVGLCRHDPPPSSVQAKRSKRSAAMAMSSGTPVRYQ